MEKETFSIIKCIAYQTNFHGQNGYGFVVVVKGFIFIEIYLNHDYLDRC